MEVKLGMSPISWTNDDLPEPEIPVNTISLSRGSSISTALRLCSLAPFTTRFSATFLI